MDDIQVKEFLQQQFVNYVKDLEALTNIDFGNGDPEGIDRAAKFIPTIDARGVENFEEHTDHEYVDLNTAVPTAVVLVLMMAEITESWSLA